jgi:hypothetical protein
VTAVRSMSSGRVKLISWQISTGGTAISRIADSGDLAGAGDLIDVALWDATPTTQPPVTLITTIRSSNSGRLKLIAWRLFATGGFTRVGDSGSQAGEVDLIAAEADASNGFFVTPVRASGDNRLKIIGWKVSSSPTAVSFDRLGDTGTQAGDIDALASALMNLNVATTSRTLLTAVRSVQSGRLKLIAWLIEHPGGKMTRKADSGDLAGQVGLVSANYSPDTGIVTAVKVQSSNRLRLIWWFVTGNNPETPEGVYEFVRVADSGNLAGQIDRVSSLLLPGNNAFTPVLTAVRSSQSQKLKLILWHLNKT